MPIHHSYPAPETASTASGDESASGSGSVAGMASRAADAVRQQADVVADQIGPRLEALAGYARDEPAKALLIAAATGAGLMALVALATRGNGKSSIDKTASRVVSSAGNIDKSDIAALLRDFASRLPGAATSAAQAASSAADSSKDRASAIAKSVVDTVTDTLKGWGNQASPVVDRIRPQIDAATAYAKEEPVKVALGVAVTGAILAGLVAALRSDD